MPDAADFRIDLLASQRAGSVRAAARLLTAAAAFACAAALLLAPSPLRAAATLASVAALAFCPGRAPSARQLVIGIDGAIRAGGDDEVETAAVRYFGPRFVCLQTPRGALAVWPDSMTATGWRRLLVACRWQRPPEPIGAVAAAGSRTK